MKIYNSYKDSNIEWIGKIPSHWTILRGKYWTKIISGFAFDSNKFTKEEGYIGLIRIRDIYKTETEMNYKGSYSKDAIVQTGDILIGMDGDFNIERWKGKPALLNQRVCKICNTKKGNENYLFYLLPRLLKCINDVTYSTTVKHLSVYDIINSELPLPPLSEQQAIATYLDKKCGEINHAIDVQKKKIDLLNELKQTIITDAVTKGLNPNAPMKDSGMEWIGQVPSHWLVCKLKNYSKIILGKMLMSNPPKGEEKKYTLEKYLKSKNVGWLQVYDNYDEVEEMWFNKYEKSIYRLQINDLVMNEGGDIGKIGLWNNTEYSCYIQNSINKISVIGNLSPFYLQYLLFAIAKTNYFWSIVNPISIAHLTKEKLSNTPILVPSFSEQQAIVKFLDEECAKIEAKISKANRRIELLEELKQSIITEAVTGKIKVC